MKGGRKNLKRAAKEDNLTLEDGQTIMQVVSLRGSNLIEVMDAKGEKSLALFPAKFQKSMWIKRGSFVVVDESGKEKALESGSKVACIVTQVLFYHQVRALQKSPLWTEIFKSTTLDDSKGSLHGNSQQQGDDELDSSDDNGLPTVEANTNRIDPPEFQEEDELDSSDDDDGLPPLEANTNRIRPPEFQSDAESDSGSDTDS
ncbi:probable RNA-binding protein EIF1AD [Ricinus communis]|uniref:probable RNA-binding protein EIF1AD n=1 Tax=Ricinus communis TaxID=3988 RepID=UPI00077216CA|nr:probable RNA-binding protein EIF1AD [Ricinus communis]|eukprot:XP_015583371.1 probable RNA-binding protein EIF1AD [Ricinus communis]